MTATWDCEAYGQEGTAVGALCFFADVGQRVCADAEECATRMGGERQRVYGRISELAAAGDPAGVYLAEEFARPGQLLGGEDPAPCCRFHDSPVAEGLDPDRCSAAGGYCCDNCPTLTADGGDR